MDPITHAVSGAVFAYSIPTRFRPTTRLFAIFAGLMAASPDIDVVFATIPIDYLLLHRGITHSFAAIPIMAVLLALLAFPLWVPSFREKYIPLLKAKLFNKQKPPQETTPAEFTTEDSFFDYSLDASKHEALSSVATTSCNEDKKNTEPEARVPWTFFKTVILAAVCLLLHIWLDIVTTYGTMIFLPFSEYRVRLNGIFIVDILLTLPLILTMWHGSKFRPYAIMGLIWMFLYPAACVGVRAHHEAEWRSHLQQEAIEEERGKLVDVTVYPDAFAPVYWRVVYQTQKEFKPLVADAYTWPQGKSRITYMFPSSENTVYHQGFDILGRRHSPLLSYPALRTTIAQSLTEESRRARAFLEFTVMPIQERKALSAQGEEWGIYDLRFASMLLSIHGLINERNKGNPTFLLEARQRKSIPSTDGSSVEATKAAQAETSSQGTWETVRLLFPGAGQDSGWQSPQKPAVSTSFWQWLVGISY